MFHDFRRNFLRFAAVAAVGLFAWALAAPGTAYADAFQDGRDAYNKGDWGLTIATLRPLAEEGDPRAMVLLGNLYTEGHGVNQDYREAYTLYRRAAFHDNPDAMVALGAMYQNGLGTAKNVPLAIQWFHRAARLGNQSGEMMYAMHIYRGFKTNDGSFDLKPDNLEAYKWFRIAATHGEDRKIRHAAYSFGLRVSTEIKEYEADEINRKVDDWAPDTPDTIGPNPEQAAIDAEKKKILEGNLKSAPDKAADQKAVDEKPDDKKADAGDAKKAAVDKSSDGK
jgi:TPR repeat protein